MRPIILKLSVGQVSDYKGAATVLEDLPRASHLIADRGYDSAWFRQALTDKGIDTCIPSSRSRRIPFPYDKDIYRQRHKVENLFAKLKGWRRIASRYDRMRTHLPLGNLHRCDYHLLDQ